jgi:hypothetical protein
MKRVELAFAPLAASGISVTPPDRILEDYPLKYLPLAYSVADPCHVTIELTQVLAATFAIRNVADFFCFIPLWRGARFMEGAFHLSARQLADMAEGIVPNWESLVPMTIPPHLLDLLPATSFRTSQRLQVQRGAQALNYAIETLRERHRRIAALASEQPSEVEQRAIRQQYEHLHALEQRLAVAALKFAADLRTASATSTNPAACVSLCEAYERLSQILSSDGISHLDLAQSRVVTALGGVADVVNSLREEPEVPPVTNQ